MHLENRILVTAEMGSAKALLELENRPFTAHSTRWAITRRTRATGLIQRRYLFSS
jgi:hypothetical protein